MKAVAEARRVLGSGLFDSVGNGSKHAFGEVV